MLSRGPRPGVAPEPSPLWYKDAIIYQAHVRAFADSNGDGIGDFRGFTSRLDYLRDLGVTAIWLLPFYPSPLLDDGYDIADYTAIHHDYGTMADFRVFLREAHARGLRIITELVINHTSERHAWFQRARFAPPGSRWRNFYVWSDTADRYREARIIFKDFESSNWAWDREAKAYYWHRFYSHQPDLNFDNPQVHRAVFRAMDFWLDMGVDGLRLDAIPYLYEREGTNCENLAETHAFLRKLRQHVDQKYADRMLIAEANQWPEDAVAYFGGGDECHMAFHFPVMPRMFMALRMEDRFPIVDILQQTPNIPDMAQWAVFLRNHDELTLEMVTDEERDYMYRVYAHDQRMRINLGIRRRLAPLLENNRRRIELMKGLLFSLPGTPVLYYGDELGMGDNIYLGDRNGVRTPMQWSADRNAGFSSAPRQRLYLPVISDAEYHYEAVNVEAQQANTQSLLWWMKRLIALRKGYKAFGRGSIEFLHPENRKVLAFVRRYEDEAILVVANLSRFAQGVELDLSSWRGMVPIEMFGKFDFPPIGDLPYFVTLGPHSFYWFTLEPQPVATGSRPGTGTYISVSSREAGIPIVAVAGAWDRLLNGAGRAQLNPILFGYLPANRWFGGKARHLKTVELVDAVPIAYEGGPSYLAMLRVDYVEGDEETYVLPIGHDSGERAGQLLHDRPHLVVARTHANGHGDTGVMYDALAEPAFTRALLDVIARRRRLRGTQGQLIASVTREFRNLASSGEPLPPSLLRAEQSNTSVVYGDKLILKLYRRPDEGMNPDLEIGRFLTEQGFPHAPRIAGAIEYRRGSGQPMTLAILQEYIPNEGDAWQYTLDSLGRFFESALGLPPLEVTPPSTGRLLELADEEPPELVQVALGDYLEWTRVLGRRTAELHLALASSVRNPDFAPEPLTALYQRSMYQTMRRNGTQTVLLLRRRLGDLPEGVRDEGQQLIAHQDDLVQRFRAVMQRRINGVRTRVHGDFHLGQVLHTGKDVYIIDFEGEPARPLSERRLKRPPLRDVAGMLRSFDYAAHAALRQGTAGVAVRAEDVPLLRPWAQFWQTWASAAFLKGYFDVARGTPILPPSMEDTETLLNALLLEKAAYELTYELNNRPDWAAIPLRGILQLLGLSRPEDETRHARGDGVARVVPPPAREPITAQTPSGD